MYSLKLLPVLHMYYAIACRAPALIHGNFSEVYRPGTRSLRRVEPYEVLHLVLVTICTESVGTYRIIPESSICISLLIKRLEVVELVMIQTIQNMSI